MFDKCKSDMIYSHMIERDVELHNAHDSQVGVFWQKWLTNCLIVAVTSAESFRYKHCSRGHCHCHCQWFNVHIHCGFAEYRIVHLHGHQTHNYLGLFH